VKREREKKEERYSFFLSIVSCSFTNSNSFFPFENSTLQKRIENEIKELINTK